MEEGLKFKYVVEKIKESDSIKAEEYKGELEYFVLKPRGNGSHNIASRKAMLVYAEEVENIYPKLAKDLRDWVKREDV